MEDTGKDSPDPTFLEHDGAPPFFQLLVKAVPSPVPLLAYFLMWSKGTELMRVFKIVLCIVEALSTHSPQYAEASPRKLRQSKNTEL